MQFVSRENFATIATGARLSNFISRKTVKIKFSGNIHVVMQSLHFSLKVRTHQSSQVIEVLSFYPKNLVFKRKHE